MEIARRPYLLAQEHTMLTDVAIKKLPIPTRRRELPNGKVSGLYIVLQPTT